ncbi:T-complex protein 1 subunit eta [Plecturocebus cupreus]
MMPTPVILLEEGTDSSQSIPQPEGLHPQIVIQAFRTAIQLAVNDNQENHCDHEEGRKSGTEEAAWRSVPSLSSKIISQQKAFFTKMVVDAMMMLNERIHHSGTKIVLSKLSTGDVVTQYFAGRGRFCAGQVPEKNLKSAMMACRESIQTSVNALSADVLGSYQLFEETLTRGERYNFFTGIYKTKTCTLICHFMEETEQSMHDTILIVRRAIKNDSVVAGGGAMETELSKYLWD